MVDYLDLFNIYLMGSLQVSAGFYFFYDMFAKQGKSRILQEAKMCTFYENQNLYFVLSAVFATSFLTAFKAEGIFSLLVFIILLAAAGNLFCKIGLVCAVLYAVIITEIMNLCFGVSDSLSCILIPVIFDGNPKGGIFLMAAGNMSALMMSMWCYRAIKRCCAWNQDIGKKSIFMILMPALLIFLVSEYINTNIYGNTVIIEENGSVSGIHPYLTLSVQMLGIASLFCILSAYKKLAECFRLKREASILEQQAHAFRQYGLEARFRYEKTKSFRHDIKNHITVVKELLENRKTEAALQYIEEMQGLAAEISFPVSTNHPVLDVLVGNKLGIAKDSRIEVQCHIMLPYPCGISDTDLCIMVGNALDNAISACNQLDQEKQKFIHLTGKTQGDFLFMEIENSFHGRKNIRSGTGLANIRRISEKYHGTVEIRTEGEIFVLRILAIIPQQPESIYGRSCLEDS